MRAHLLFLAVVGSCVAVLGGRARAGAGGGENRPISNLQLLTPRQSGPPPASPSVAPATSDNVQIVKWLLRALHRYLYENGADDLAEIEGPNAREPEFITVVVERVDEGEGEAEQRGDEENDEDLPILPYVERDPRYRSQEPKAKSQVSHDFRIPYQQTRSQKRLKPYRDDPQQRYQEYLQELLDAEELDDDEDLLQNVQHYRDAPKPLLNLQGLGPGHSIKDHLEQLPAELQERVALQAHVEHEKGCTWCALLRASGVAPSKPPSASPPPPKPTNQKLGAALPDPWFSQMGGRKWMVLHEDYPGMMQQMMNLVLDHRARNFRAHWTKDISNK